MCIIFGLACSLTCCITFETSVSPRYCNHYLFVPTDLTFTTDRLTELFQSLENPDNPALYVIGIGKQLGLPQSALEEVRRSYQSKAKRKEAYLDTYTHHHPCPSWKRISMVLRGCDLNQQADEVENTYVQGMHARYRPVHMVTFLLNIIKHPI